MLPGDYIFVLLGAEVLLWAFSYVMTKGNLLSPSLITCTVFIAATACIIYNIDFWNVHYSLKACAITSVMLVVMVASEGVAMSICQGRSVSGRRRNLSGNKSDRRQTLINIPAAINAFFVLTDLILGVYVIYCVMRNGAAGGAEGLSAIGVAKEDEDAGLSGFGRLSYKYTWLLFIIYSFIVFSNSSVKKGSWRKHPSYLMPIAVVCASTFFMGNRANFLKIIATCYIFWVACGRLSERRNVSLGKALKTVLPAVVLLLVVFYLTREITKLSTTTGERTFVDYITYYVGSPVYLFSAYLDNPSLVHNPPVRFGELTFQGFYGALGYETLNQRYTYVGGNSLFAGNVYSWLCRPYNDFGLAGSLLFTAIVYFAFSMVIYGPLSKKIQTDRRDCTLIVFAFVYYVVFMSFYYCQICWVSNPTNLVYAVALVVLYKAARNKVLIVGPPLRRNGG